jgi:hypothetical protein
MVKKIIGRKPQILSKKKLQILTEKNNNNKKNHFVGCCDVTVCFLHVKVLKFRTHNLPHI